MKFRQADYVWLIDADVVYARRNVDPQDSIGMSPTWEIATDDILDVLERVGLRVEPCETRPSSVRLWRSAALSGTVTWDDMSAHVGKNELVLNLWSDNGKGNLESLLQSYGGRYLIAWARGVL